MAYVGLLLHLIPIFASNIFLCTDTNCKDEMLSDGICNHECMNPSCNFDSFYSGTWDSNAFKLSDCYIPCFLSSCAVSNLGNSVCDQACNNYECGWDLGDCGSCADMCFLSDLGNRICESACNTPDCMFDNNDCGWCESGCFKEMLSDGVCDEVCNTKKCKFDNGDCNKNSCSAGCYDHMKGNGLCDQECNNAVCDFDLDDCSCSPGCSKIILTEPSCRVDGSGKIIDPCATEQCEFKSGKCGECASGCFLAQLGDGICDEHCFNRDCQYDKGDCKCALGCESYYDQVAQQFNFIGGCSIPCLVPSCQYNYKVCNDPFLIRAAILSQIIKNDWTSNLNLADCSPECSEAMLRDFDLGQSCKPKSACNTKECLFCAGNSETKLSTCLRKGDGSCLICSDSVINLGCGSPFSDCPVGSISLGEVSSLFDPGLKICVPEPVDTSGNQYEHVYVNSTCKKPSGEMGSGSIKKPYLSLYSALSSIQFAFTKVILSPEVHIFVEDTLLAPNPAILDRLDPLSRSPPRVFSSLWIMSEDAVQKAIIYWTSKMKLSPNANKVYFVNIDFKGNKILRPCSAEFCLYCPSFSVVNSNYFDDRGTLINSDVFNDEYAASCSDHHLETLFTFNGPAYFQDVRFEGFRQQFQHLILTDSSLYLNRVDFSKLQASAQGTIIAAICERDCVDAVLEYSSGVVCDLGAGYEITDATATGSFLFSFQFSSIILKNIDFSYNIVYNSVSSQIKGSLISILQPIHNVEVVGCSFYAIISNSMIIINSTNSGVLNLRLANTSFSSIYCSDYFIDIEKGRNNNIAIIQIKINEVVVGLNEILKVYTQGSDLDKEIFDLDISVVSIYSLGIESSFSCKSFILLENLPKLMIEGLSISMIENNAINIINVIFNRITAGGRYIMLPMSYSERIHGVLELAMVVKHSNNVAIYSVYIESSEVSGFLINSVSDSCALGYIGFYNSSSASSLLKVIDSGTVTLINTIFELVYSEKAILDFTNIYDVTLSKLAFNNVQARQNSIIFLNQANKVVVESLKMNNSTTIYGNGGCLSIITSKYGTRFIGNDFKLVGCSTQAQGGGIYIDNPGSNSLVLLVDKIDVVNNTAQDGAFLYITNNVIFNDKDYSLIQNLNCTNNFSPLSHIVDEHKSGVLAFVSVYFTNIHARNSGIRGSYQSNSLVLSCIRFSIKSSISYGPIFSFSASIETTLLFSSITLINSGAEAFEAIFARINVTDSKFVGLLAVSESAVNINMFFTNCSFEGFDSLLFIVTYQSWLYLDSCTFSKNQYGLISSADGNLIINNCKFTDNTYSTLALITFSGESALLLIMNTDFSNNILQAQSLISISVGTNTTFLKTKFINNRGLTKIFSVINAKFSNIYATSCTFQNTTTEDSGSFFYLNTATAFLTQVSFNNGKAGEYGGAIYALSSSIILRSVACINSSAKIAGGCLWSLGESSSPNVIINDSYFSQCSSTSGSAIWQTTGMLIIVNSSFENCLGMSSDRLNNSGVVSSDRLKILGIHLSKFNNTQNSNAIILLSNYKSAIINTSIDNTEGCSLFIYDTHKEKSGGDYLLINSSIARSLSKNSGAGLSLIESSLVIANSSIRNNRALKDGGGIYFKTLVCKNCFLLVDNASDVTENLSDRDGGGIKWLGSEPTIQGLVSKNKANYGDNLANEPVVLHFMSSGYFYQNSSLITLTLAPGQTFTGFLLALLYDKYGNLVSTDSSHFLQISSGNRLLSILNKTKFQSVNGMFNITDFLINGPPDYHDKIILTVMLFSSDTSNPKILGTYYVQLYLRNCTFGEQINYQSCIKCPENKYTILPSDNCKPCPKGCYCKGGLEIYPLPGYWRSSNISEIIYRCSIPEACLGGNNSNLLGQCAEGYTGLMCQSCEPHFSMELSSTCKKCPKFSVNIFRIALVVILIIVCLIFVIKATLASAFKPKSMQSIYIKMILNYCQLVYLISRFNLNWPYYLTEFFSFQQAVAASSEELVSIDCLVSEYDLATSFSKVYYLKITLFSVLPIVIMVLSFLAWSVIAFLKEKSSYLKNELFTTIIILFFFIYPNLEAVLFKNFDCVYVDKLGYFLGSSMDIVCFGKEHSKYSLLIVIPSILIWSISTPVLILVLIIKRKRSLNKYNNLVVFGFLYNGYELHNYYWEFIIILRKNMIILILTFVSKISIMVQAYTIILVIICFIYLHLSNHSYTSTELNNMETLSLVIATVTIICGIYYMSDEVSSTSRVLLFVVIVVINGYFLLYWLYYFLKASLEGLSRRYPLVRKIIKFGDSYLEEFYVEELRRKGVKKDEKSKKKKIFTFLNYENENRTQNFNLHNMETLNELALMYKYKIILK